MLHRSPSQFSLSSPISHLHASICLTLRIPGNPTCITNLAMLSTHLSPSTRFFSCLLAAAMMFLLPGQTPCICPVTPTQPSTTLTNLISCPDSSKPLSEDFTHCRIISICLFQQEFEVAHCITELRAAKLYFYVLQILLYTYRVTKNITNT